MWEAPAKLLHRTGGYNGTLKIAQDVVVFQSARGSRTWRLSDIDNFSSAGPFELTVTSLDAETRFQLKQPLPEDRYNDLWRHFQRATGPKTFQPFEENHHE